MSLKLAGSSLRNRSKKKFGNRGWIMAKIVQGYRGGHHIALHPLQILIVHQVYTDN